MKILVSNDDGIQAAGVRCLVAALAQMGRHQVTVVCPDRERSATGHALTLHKPLRLDPVREGFPPEVQAWACSGTPSDCVKLGLDGLLDHPPDWVISGINQGANLGTDVLYSGTVSAAMEGLLEGIPSLAVSLASFTHQDFQPAAQVVLMLLEKLSLKPLEKPMLLNVNVPPLELAEIRGMVLARLAWRKYTDLYEKRVDPRGKAYYWLAGEVVEEEVDPCSDVRAVAEGYVSITPLQPDLTAYAAFESLQRWGLSAFGF